MIGFIELTQHLIPIDKITLLELVRSEMDVEPAAITIHLSGEPDLLHISNQDDCRKFLQSLRVLTEKNFKMFQIVVNR